MKPDQQAKREKRAAALRDNLKRRKDKAKAESTAQQDDSASVNKTEQE